MGRGVREPLASVGARAEHIAATLDHGPDRNVTAVRGLGRALLGALVDRCAAAGLRQMIAVIGDSGNAASIGLHASLGFARAGLLPAVGFKHGRWVDSVVMQRPLGPGDRTPPV